MDFNATIDIILKDLRDVRMIMEDMRNSNSNQRLQIELAISKCKSSEEIITLLKTIKPPEAAVRTEVVTADPGKKIADETLIEITSEPAPGENIEVESRPEAAILADRFQSKSDTVIDHFGNLSREEGISSVLRTKPLESLRQAIGVNDRFLFIRELFSGNSQLYEEAISKLESAKNFEEAKSALSGFTAINDENEVGRQLLDLLKRKVQSDG